MPAAASKFKSEIRPTWCPGCGDFGVLNALATAAADLKLDPDQTALVTGIGCSSKLAQYFGSYGFHTLHGRALPVAQGVKLANRDLTVIAAGGDGDGYGIGLGHFVHAMRRNIDITYIVMDNHIYGLTTGQFSPTSDRGTKSKTSPEGSIDRPIRPLELALAAHCGFVAQGFSGNQKQLAALIKEAITFPGFALVNVFSPCVTYNKVNGYDFFREHVVTLPEDGSYDPHNREQAFATVHSNPLVTGVIYREEIPDVTAADLLPGYAEHGLATADLTLSTEEKESLLSGFTA